MFKYLAQPPLSCPPTPVARSIPSLSPLSVPRLSLAASPNAKSPDRVGRVQVQAGWKGGRGGESSIVGLDSALSPLEHPLMGEAR